MWQYVSLCRDEEGLLEAKRQINELKQSMLAIGSAEDGEPESVLETSNMLLVAELVISAALRRRESRGSHWRRDYESLDESLAGCHYVLARATPVDDLAMPREEVIAHA